MIENLAEFKQYIEIEAVLRLIAYPMSSPQLVGNEIRDFCPIHCSDNGRSLSVNVLTKQAYCHACNFAGDAIELYRKAKNLDFTPAVKALAAEFNFELKYTAAIRSDLPKETRTPQQVLADSALNGSHIYLEKKCIEPCEGLYYGKDALGNSCIIVPFSDVNGQLKTVQFVREKRHPNDLSKIFLSGHSPKEAFFTIGNFEDGDIVYFSEGIATALTIWMAYDKKVPVVSFGSINNLSATIEVLLNKFPNLIPIICLDLDKNNPNMPVQAALIQIKKSRILRDCKYRMPSFEGLTGQKNLTDFNDLVSVCNQSFDLVNKQLQKEVIIDEFLQVQPIDSAANTQPSLLREFEYDVLAYMVNRSYEELITDGLSIEQFENIFSNDISRKIFWAIEHIWERGLKPSSTEISLLHAGEDEDRVFEFVNKLNGRESLNADQIKNRLQKLHETSAWRVLTSELSQIKQGNISIYDAAQRIRKTLDAIQASSESTPSQSALLHHYVEEITFPKYRPIATGFAQVDRLLGGGFKAGEVGLLTGGAGSGKSAFALQLCDQVAQNGACAIYFSMEVGKQDLTERSLKRLGWRKSDPGSLHKAIEAYKEFADNIVLIKGYHSMPISQVRGKVLSIMRERKQDVVVFIDPFQRLGTGDKKIDLNNETLKVNLLISEIKEMAVEMEIPILVLSDTVKDHVSNSSGEGSARGSYMADHTADYTMMLKADKNLFTALYGESDTSKLDKSKQNDPTYKSIKTKASSILYTQGKYSVSGDHRFYDKYVALVTPKVRNSARFSPLFIYKPGIHRFEETDLWDGILPKEG